MLSLEEMMSDPKKMEEAITKVAGRIIQSQYVYPGEVGPTPEEIRERLEGSSKMTQEEAQSWVDIVEDMEI